MWAGFVTEAVMTAIFVAVILFVVASLLLPIGTVAFWGQRTVVDTAQYVETVTPLSSDPAIQDAVANMVSDQVVSAIDVQSALSSYLPAQGQVLVMDTFWDRQRYDIAAYCLINTSPYFTAMASGNSKVYESGDYIRLAEAAGLRLLTVRDGIGYCHSLLRFARA